MGKDYKLFNFNSKDDYLFVLYGLISRMYKSLKRYKRYQEGLENYLLSLIDEEMIYVDTDICEEWQDKVLSVSRGIMTVLIDEVKGGISYVKLRKMLNKTEFKLEPLGDDIEKELAELRDVRNWSFHLPQTDFVAAKEVFLKNIPKELHQCVTYNFNPIKIEVFDKTNRMFLESLYLHNKRRIEIFDKIFAEMIKDFETLLGQHVEVVEINEKPAELLDETSATIQLSMAMNRRKYDGSNKMYEKITFQKPKFDE